MTNTLKFSPIPLIRKTKTENRRQFPLTILVESDPIPFLKTNKTYNMMPPILNGQEKSLTCN